MPALGACLVVQVDDDGAETGGFRGDGKGGFVRVALLWNKRNCSHVILLLLYLTHRIPCNHAAGKGRFFDDGAWVNSCHGYYPMSPHLSY